MNPDRDVSPVQLSCIWNKNTISDQRLFCFGDVVGVDAPGPRELAIDVVRVPAHFAEESFCLRPHNSGTGRQERLEASACNL